MRSGRTTPGPAATLEHRKSDGYLGR